MIMSMRIRIYAYIYIYVYAYMYIHIYIYTAYIHCIDVYTSIQRKNLEKFKRFFSKNLAKKLKNLIKI